MTSTPQNYQILTLTNKLIIELKAAGFHLLLYRAKSSNSAYLKLDCGLCGTIRISDHSGKKHLKYKWNLLTFHTGPVTTHTSGYTKRHFFAPEHLPILISKILAERENRLLEDSAQVYNLKLRTLKERIGRDKGFWQGCEEV